MSGWTEADKTDFYARKQAEARATIRELMGAEPASKPDGKLEAEIQAECTEFLAADGWRPLRTDPVSNKARGTGFGEKGMADYQFSRPSRCETTREHVQVSPRGRVAPRRGWCQLLYVEFKRIKPSGQPTGAQKHQIAWHQKERARGFLTVIAGIDFPASVDGFKRWYAASGLQRRDR